MSRTSRLSIRVLSALAIISAAGVTGYFNDDSAKTEGFIETFAVVDCEAAASRELLSPASMSRVGAYTIDWTVVDGHAVIEADFNAKNTYSVPLPFHDLCVVNGTTGRVLSVDVTQGYQF